MRKHWIVPGPRIGSASATRQPKATSSGSSSVLPLIDSPPFDSIIERGIAEMQRPSRSHSTSIENSSPSHTSCTIEGTGV